MVIFLLFVIIALCGWITVLKHDVKYWRSWRDYWQDEYANVNSDIIDLTHQLNEVLQLCENMVTVPDGEVMDGTPDTPKRIETIRRAREVYKKHTPQRK